MDFVLPGEILASEEEYLNSNNTYVDNDGNIRASKVGKKKLDLENKKISVVGRNTHIFRGDVIEGKVINVRDKMILVAVDRIFDKWGKEKGNYISSVAILVSDITTSYLENIKDTAKIGDLIRAEICMIKPGLINCSTKGFDYGVILAFCTKCRHKLKTSRSDNKNRELREMICEKCKNVEKRKTSKYYYG